MAHTKAKGSARINKDSISKRLGVKKFSNEAVEAGNIIVRQRGTRFKNSTGTKIGKDFTIYAVKTGKVRFFTKLGKKHIKVV
jgi:large subunit ribosomal protein L27